MRLRWWLLAGLLALVTGAVGGPYGAALIMTDVPGKSHTGPLPPLTSEEKSLAAVLKRHVEAIGSRPHNIEHPDELEEAARYIETSLGALGYTVNRHPFTVDETTVRNIEVVISPASTGNKVPTIVVGAHYDSCENASGANDNASGVAAVLELARLLRDLDGKTPTRIRLVLFVNEEPPYFQTPDMGSVHYAAELKAQGENVVAMYAFDDIGYYSSDPGSQHYPWPFDLVFGDKGDFVAFVAMAGSRDLLNRTVASFRSHTAFPSVGGFAPGFVPGIDWSDHWSFAEQGFQALMITDTAIFRYPYYHKPADTPDKVDAEKLARLVKGIERVVRDMAK